MMTMTLTMSVRLLTETCRTSWKDRGMCAPTGVSILSGQGAVDGDHCE